MRVILAGNIAKFAALRGGREKSSDRQTIQYSSPQAWIGIFGIDGRWRSRRYGCYL